MKAIRARAVSAPILGMASVLLTSSVVCHEREPAVRKAPSADLSAAGRPETASAGSVDAPAADDWCAEHGVPESVCTRCDPGLAAKFKAADDWCAEHGLPESQCALCDPAVKTKWAALRPRASDDGGVDIGGGIRLERGRRLLTGANDALCQVDLLRVRFVDRSIVEKAGIRTAPATLRRISATIEVPAEVEFDQTRVAQVTPQVGGVVREALVNAGDQVDVGALLAVIESSELGEAKSRFIELRAKHALAQADYDRARQIHEGAQQLLAVCTAEASFEELSAKLGEVRVGEAKSKLLRAHANLLLARTTEQRARQLLARQVSSEQDYEQARSAWAATQAEFWALREDIAFASERDYLNAARELQVARTVLQAAERKLHILGLSHEQIATLAGESDETLSRYVLRSPLAGRVIQRRVAVGELVDQTTALLTVADTSSMWLMMNAQERDLLQLRPGLPVLCTIDGLPGRSFEGRITWIASQVDERTRTVQVRAQLPNQDGLLRARMFGSARIVVHDNEPAVTVPAEAVQTDGCCQLVFVRQDEDVFQPRKVALGSSANGFVEVLDGLKEGELVATTGSFLMKTEILKGNLGAGCCEVDPGR